MTRRGARLAIAAAVAAAIPKLRWISWARMTEVTTPVHATMLGLQLTVMMTTMMMISDVHHCSSEGISEGIIEEGSRLSSMRYMGGGQPVPA